MTLDMAPGDILVLLSDGFYEQANAAGELFGESRVQTLVAAHHRETVAGLLDVLLPAPEKDRVRAAWKVEIKDAAGAAIWK